MTVNDAVMLIDESLPNTIDDSLNARQQLFVDYYSVSLNATLAAKMAGYGKDEASQAVIGSRLLRNVKIASVLTQQFTQHTMSSAEILAHLTDIARADIGLAITESGDIDIKQLKLMGKSQWVKKYERRTYTTMDTDGNERLVTETKLELHDKLDALKFLGKFHGIVYDRLKIEIDWEKQAIQSIQAGQLTYTALADLFDKEKAAQLFLAAGVPVQPAATTPADTVEGQYSELDTPVQSDTDSATDE